MHFTARLLLPLAVILASGALSCACRTPAGSPSPEPAGAAPRTGEPAIASLAPSPRLIVGRVLSVDREQHFAIVDLQSDAPAGALAAGAELRARDYQSLGPTAVLRASRFVRGRTLGATIVSGQPSPGDEVVWLAP